MSSVSEKTNERSWIMFKESTLNSLEEAKADGLVDEPIIPLLSLINRHPNYVTTSSCSGRLLLLAIKEHKKDAYMYKRWHDIPSLEEVKKTVENYDDEKALWYKVEPFILHVAAKDIESAMKFAKVCKAAGLKRFGIQPIRTSRFLIELQGTGRVEIPLESCPAPNWQELISTTERLMKKNWERMNHFYDVFAETFKEELLPASPGVE